jgi:hypothetical protein
VEPKTPIVALCTLTVAPSSCLLCGFIITVLKRQDVFSDKRLDQAISHLSHIACLFFHEKFFTFETFCEMPFMLHVVCFAIKLTAACMVIRIGYSLCLSFNFFCSGVALIDAVCYRFKVSLPGKNAVGQKK